MKQLNIEIKIYFKEINKLNKDTNNYIKLFRCIRAHHCASRSEKNAIICFNCFPNFKRTNKLKLEISSFSN